MKSEPYRPLFPLGLLSGFAGVAIWLLHFAGWLNYPMIAHAHVMLFGFFLCFVSGSLMTALPHISGGRPATFLETMIATLLIMGGVVAALAGAFGLAYGFSALQIIFLGAFVVRRFGGKRTPPAGFVFVPAGLIWGLFGALTQVLAFGEVSSPAFVFDLARIAVQEAFLLNLILGLGSRLIPFLTGVQSIVPTEQSSDNGRASWLVFVPLNASFFIEAAGFSQMAWSIRATVLTYAAVKLFKIHLPRPMRSHVGLGLRVSVLTMTASYFCLPVWPTYQIALLHLIFIGGFTLMTIMVATRVILAHGGFPIEIERKSGFVAAAGILLLAAAFTRGFYFLPVAATLWLLAVSLWFFGIGRKAFK